MSKLGTWKENSKGENILWNANNVGSFIETYDPKVKTLGDAINLAVERFGDMPCNGRRPLIKREMVDIKGKKFEKLSFENHYKYVTYKDFGKRITDFGAGLTTFAELKPKEKVLIYAETQPDWMTAAFACWQRNYSVVTAYATLGAEGAKYSINLTKSRVVVADSKLLKILLTVQPDCEQITHIISEGEVDPEQKKQLEDHGVKVATFEELVAMGAEAPVEATPPAPEDTAVIMFTSGTTGNPKGVVILHKQILSAVAGVKPWLEKAGITAGDVYAAYLPLAHIMEIAAEISLYSLGCTLGYGSPHTLTDTGVKLKQGQTGDLKILKPTVMVFAPAVLEKIYNAITLKTENLTGLKKILFDWGKQSGESNFNKGVVGSGWLYNAMVFKKIQALVGGRLKCALTGSAPLDGGVHKFIQTALCVPVRQGYGSTETCAASFVQDVHVSKIGSVGAPLKCCAMKLKDWEEGNYRTSDKENPAIGKPRGEIVVGGPEICNGYYVDPENPDEAIVKKNNEEFEVDEDGIRWFYTGDIGQVDEDGTLAIIDRKKDLVKLQQGEYVSLSKVEGLAKTASFVENALLHVDPANSYCTILVCPMVAAVQMYADHHKLESSHEEIIQTPEFNKAVLDQIHGVCKGKLAKFEIPKKVYCVPIARTWTPENDLLTAAMKLKRKPIQKAFEAEIKSMY